MFYELAFHFNPHCAEACNNLGVIYKDRDNLDKAVECYQAIFTACAGFKAFFCWMFGVHLSCSHKCHHPFYLADGFINKTKLFPVIEQPWCCLYSPGLVLNHF